MSEDEPLGTEAARKREDVPCWLSIEGAGCIWIEQRPTTGALRTLGDKPEGDELTDVTLRPESRLNSMIYGISDKPRELAGREIVLTNSQERPQPVLAEGQRLTSGLAVKDGLEQVVRGLRLAGDDPQDRCKAANSSNARARE
jgi:hypothetical protein